MASISVNTYKFLEGKDGDVGKMQFIVLLSEPASQDVTVDYTTADSKAKNAAKADVDYTAVADTLTIKAGDTSGTISVDILGDALKEGNEIFNLILSQPTGAGFAKGEILQIVGTIVDDEPIIWIP
ncbi:MAG: Calx-beta domain-containing protein [Azovibrio sp.]|uniref:Calx-beta domain-containing protein n=1 Tax=Azovibrio sp. TaxID=1872673 RepID=UPI003C74F9FD